MRADNNSYRRKHRKKHKRNRQGNGRAASILAVICLGIAAFLGLKILQTEVGYHRGIRAYEQMAEIAAGTEDRGDQADQQKENAEGPGAIPASSAENADVARNAGTGSGSNADGNNPDDPDVTLFSEKSAETRASRDAKTGTSQIPPDLPEINFKALQEVNPDIVGWIYSPDTTINYPVVQGSDNSYYLNHLADGTENRNGCPFLDMQNRADFMDDNSIIYGHHMQNGTMFAGISWYEDQSYYDEHPVMYLMTPAAVYRIELFSGYTTTMDSSAYMQSFGSIREHTDWLKEISRKSDFEASLEISALDRVITLSTCAYSFENARYVLHGKLVELH